MTRRLLATRRPMYFAAGASAFTGPYDAIQTDVKGAYSVRRLFGSYAGSSMRIRRSSDNAEADIGFTAAGDFDTTAFSAHVSGGQGYAVTYYDQSGNGQNLTQATTTLQPELQLNIQGGRPALVFTAANAHRMLAATAAYWKFAHYTQSTFAMIVYVNDTAANKFLFSTTNANTTSGLQYYTDSNERIVIIASRLTGPASGSTVSITHTTGHPTTPMRTMFTQVDAANATASLREITYRNGTQAASNNASTSAGIDEDPQTALVLGGRTNGSAPLDGATQELILWTGLKDSAYRAIYEASARTYYGHY